MQCMNMVGYTCRSFDYDRMNRVCYLSSTTKDLSGIGLTPTQDTSPFDYYERGECGIEFYNTLPLQVFNVHLKNGPYNYRVSGGNGRVF